MRSTIRSSRLGLFQVRKGQPIDNNVHEQELRVTTTVQPNRVDIWILGLFDVLADCRGVRNGVALAQHNQRRHVDVFRPEDAL